MRPAPRRRLGLLRSCIAFCLIAMIPWGSAAQGPEAETSEPPKTSPEPLLPWLGMATTRPLVMTLSHDLIYDPAGRGLEVKSSQWDLDRLRLEGFGGRLGLAGRGTIQIGAPSDVATTITLENVNVPEVLRFMKLPRWREVEARVDGRLAIEFRGNEWRRLDITLQTRPDSFRLSRRLIKDMLANYLPGAITAEQIDMAFDHYFEAVEMIPLADAAITGSLADRRFDVRVPIRNEALNVELETQVDRATLKLAWERFLRPILEQIQPYLDKAKELDIKVERPDQ